MAATTASIITEIIDYVGLTIVHNNPLSKTNVVIYVVILTTAPAFLDLCLVRIVVVYAVEGSIFRPRTYTIWFCSCDFFGVIVAGYREHDCFDCEYCFCCKSSLLPCRDQTLTKD